MSVLGEKTFFFISLTKVFAFFFDVRNDLLGNK